LAAALFAAGHLPALAAVADPTPLLVARTLLLNTMAGVIFGYAFLRHSLEGAILAHGIGHVVIFAARVAGL
jgi:membrane protease YdiL (CAAX protease family)